MRIFLTGSKEKMMERRINGSWWLVAGSQLGYNEMEYAEWDTLLNRTEEKEKESNQ